MLDQVNNLNSEHERLQLMFERAPSFMAMVEGDDLRFTVANAAFRELVGRDDLLGNKLTEALPELDDQGFDEMLKGVGRSGEPFVAHSMPITVVRADLAPEEVVLDLVFQPLPPSLAGETVIFIQGNDITEDKKSEVLRNAHAKVLDLAISDAPIEQTLSALLRIVETSSRTGTLGSILLMAPDGKHLLSGAAPSLPRDYMEAIDGSEIGPCAGSCGTAAYLGAAVYVSDIASDPLWADYKELALAHGLRACWSIPILTRGREVLGTFAMYHRQPREPTVRDLVLVDLIIQTAALVIDRERARRELDRINASAGQSSSSS